MLSRQKLIFICFICLIIIGCTTAVSSLSRTLRTERFAYKLAYQDRGIPRCYNDDFTTDEQLSNCLEQKVNVILSDFPEKNKKVLHPSQKYNWYVLPKWSPDGQRLAFIGMLKRNKKYRKGNDKQKRGKQAGVFVADSYGANIREIFSDPKIFYSEKKLYWFKDGQHLLVSAYGKSGPEYWKISLIEGKIVKTYKESDLPAIKLYYGLRRKFSPNQQWKVVTTRDQCREWRGIGIMGNFRTKLYCSKRGASYIEATSGERPRQKIWSKKRRPSFQWTPDSRFIIMFQQNENHFYVTDLQGRKKAYRGLYPSVQVP